VSGRAGAAYFASGVFQDRLTAVEDTGTLQTPSLLCTLLTAFDDPTLSSVSIAD
jgi:hypothetical protein